MGQLVRLAAGPAVSRVRDLWAELSTSMRILRVRAGQSLRDVEAATGRGRGVLSQIETGKARPNRDLVEWYDTKLGGDNLLLSMYAEARGAHGAHAAARESHVRCVEGDAARVSDPLLPSGALVSVGATDQTAGWTLTNAGSVAWTGRRVRRVGSHAAARLISTAREVALADCRPGERVDVRIAFDVPDLAGTFAAYWQIVDRDGYVCFEPSMEFVLVVVAA